MWDLPKSFVETHVLSGFESTYMPGVGTDVLEGTRHNQRYHHDMELVAGLGIKTLRYPASWNYVERAPGHFDWDLLDRKLEALRALGLTPILDLVHHTALPDAVLPQGFAAADFAPRLTEFAARCAERYPWITHYTLFNEPYLTTQFCGELGIWFPHHRGMPSFVSMLLNVCRGIVDSAEILTEKVPGLCLMHPDTCEEHRAVEPADEVAVHSARFANIKRFIADDLLLGRVTPAHPLYSYLCENEASEADIAWFQGRPAPIHIRGLDYYPQSEWEHAGGGKRWAETRFGFAAVANAYIARYDLPVMLAETNFSGTPRQRLAWMQDMLREYSLLLHEAADVRGFCWFPFIDSTDFQHLLLKNRNDVDPVGIYDLGPDRWDRVPTLLGDYLRTLP